MKLQPIVYVTDMDRSVAWYGAVLDAAPGYTGPVWSTFDVGGAALGIHLVEDRPDHSNVVLSLVATDSLDDVVDRLRSSGIAIERGIRTEDFGRSILLRDPDGGPVQVNEHP